jgi:hypothetical protein
LSDLFRLFLRYQRGFGIGATANPADKRSYIVNGKWMLRRQQYARSNILLREVDHPQ